MGADLLINCIEIPRGKQPDWDAAEKYLKELSEDDLAEIMAEFAGEDPEEADLEDYKEGALEKCLDALKICKDGWDGDRRGMSSLSLSRTDLLIAAEMSWGEVGEDMEAIRLFATSGALIDAGFLSGDFEEPTENGEANE